MNAVTRSQAAKQAKEDTNDEEVGQAETTEIEEDLAKEPTIEQDATTMEEDPLEDSEIVNNTKNPGIDLHLEEEIIQMEEGSPKMEYSHDKRWLDEIRVTFTMANFLPTNGQLANSNLRLLVTSYPMGRCSNGVCRDHC